MSQLFGEPGVDLMKPLRVALFAPGINARVMDKAIGAGADAVILDLEDSVPIAAKAEARPMVAGIIDRQTQVTAPGPAIYVRVNNAATGNLVSDLQAVVRPGLDAVMLPKVESVEEVQEAAASIEIKETVQGMKTGSIAIILQIESALVSTDVSICQGVPSCCGGSPRWRA